MITKSRDGAGRDWTQGHASKVGSIYRVGKSLPHWDRETPEGVHYNYADNEHSFFITLRRLRPEEIDDFKYAPAEFAFRVDDGVITLIIRIGSLGPANAHYNWWLNPINHRTLPPMERNLQQRALVSLFLIEHETGEVEAIRVLTWSPEFSRRMEEEIRRQATRPEYENRASQDAVIRQLYLQYPNPDQMKDEALADCLGGD